MALDFNALTKGQQRFIVRLLPPYDQRLVADAGSASTAKALYDRGWIDFDHITFGVITKHDYVRLTPAGRAAYDAAQPVTCPACQLRVTPERHFEPVDNGLYREGGTWSTVCPNCGEEFPPASAEAAGDDWHPSDELYIYQISWINKHGTDPIPPELDKMFEELCEIDDERMKAEAEVERLRTRVEALAGDTAIEINGRGMTAAQAEQAVADFALASGAGAIISALEEENAALSARVEALRAALDISFPYTLAQLAAALDKAPVAGWETGYAIALGYTIGLLRRLDEIVNTASAGDSEGSE